MKRYLLTTAILSLGATHTAGASVIDDSAQNPVLEADFEQLQQDLSVSSQSLKNGDFLTFSRSANNAGLYSGDGSVQMKSVRTFRY